MDSLAIDARTGDIYSPVGPQNLTAQHDETLYMRMLYTNRRSLQDLTEAHYSVSHTDSSDAAAEIVLNPARTSIGMYQIISENNGEIPVLKGYTSDVIEKYKKPGDF